MPTYNIPRLGELLIEAWEDAGLPADGIGAITNVDGTIEWSELATQQHMDIAVAVKANYTELVAEDLTRVQRQALRQARTATILATVTQGQAANWQQNHITAPLAAIKTQVQALPVSALKTFALALIPILEDMDTLQRGDVILTLAERNKLWPDIQTPG